MNDQTTDWPDYQLLDFGGGRKLERFGSVAVDRPCPAAENEQPATRKWQADARFTGARVGDGKWKPPTTKVLSAGATVGVPLGGDRSFRFHLEFSPAGQVGLFPEQFANWRWIARQAARAGRPLRVLNLFAYTGGSTLAAAAASADVEVTHVDASKPSVALARQNSAASGLAEAKVRWIVEDALKYCRREVKRGSRYDAVVLDPPSYGHGPKGEEWRLARDLPVLMELIGELTARQPVFLLATCHTPGVGPAELSAYLSDGVFGSCSAPPTGSRLWLHASDGRKLESGVSVRWPR
ncbi:MAG: class I SAM-dependent methyltransferase [Planctomycetota bacterium]